MTLRLTPFSIDDARRFRQFLTELGFCTDEHRDRLLLREIPSQRRRNLPRLLDQTQDKTALNVLLRWFLIGVPVETRIAAELLPDWMPPLCEQHGLLARRQEMLVPLVRLTIWGHRIVASDHAESIESAGSSNVVIWPSNTTNHLSQFTIRRRFADVLDLGTGCGLQAILAAEHSGRVVATDVNPRATEYTAFNARLNGVENVECVTGDTFETVKDRRFDLIVTNPPFFLSPVARHVFCDSGMELDQYCRRVVREASLHLKEGGFLQMMLEWVKVRDQSWQDRLSEWFEGTGCDAWLWHEYGCNADQYAQNRIRETTAYSPEGDESNFNEWMTYYREKGVEEVHGGVLAMRRRQGQNWVLIDEMPVEPGVPFGEAIVKAFAARDFLDTHSNDDQMLATTPQLSPDVELEPRFRPSDRGWEMISMNLSLKKGVPASVALDPKVADFLGNCTGKHTLDSLIQDLASNADAAPEQVRLECLRLVRKLIERGFMVV